MFGGYQQDQEAQERVQERIAALKALLGDEPEASEVATKSRTDNRRDSSGRRISKPHAPGQPAPEPSRRRDADGYRLDKPFGLERSRRA